MSNTCPTCKGTGKIHTAYSANLEVYENSPLTDCPICRGTGQASQPNEPDKSKCPACSHDWKQHIEGVCHDNPLCECPFHEPTPDSGTGLDISGSTKYILPKWLADMLASEQRLGMDDMEKDIAQLLRQAEENGRKQWLEHELGRSGK